MNLFEYIELNKLQKNILVLLKITILISVILALIFYLYSTSIYAISLLPLIVIIGFLICEKKLISSELGLVYILYTFLYIIIPALFIILLDQDYIFGTSISSFPGDSEAYIIELNNSIFFLIILWVSMYFGLVLGNQGIKKNVFQNFNFNINRLKYLGYFVVLLQLMDVINIYEVRNGATYTINYLTQIFNDHAYLLIVTLFIVCNKSENIKDKIRLFNLVFILFLVMYTISGSKSAILVVTFLLVIYQFTLSKLLNKNMVIFYKHKYLSFMLIALPALFIMGKIFRIFLQLDFDFNKISIKYLTDELGGSILSIIYRLIQGGFDQYLAIFKNFIISDYDYDFNLIFINYIIKNTLNLLLPGTIYPEAFVMTSQLFPDVLFKGNLISTNTIENLIIKLNTQPYSIFGLFCIIFGILSPFILFIFSYYFSKLVNYISSPVLKLSLIYFFGSLLSCFGLDVVIGNTFLILIGMYTMLIVVKD